jgi:CheY-like chemotaxis protein
MDAMTRRLTRQPPARKASAPAARAALVLVVDDEAIMRELLGLHLAGAGYRVAVAEDAIAAGHRVMEQVPDLIISDFKMPYMNGNEFISALRADATIPHIPVIFITSEEHSTELSGRTFGFPLLTKPLVVDEVLAVVASQLGARRSVGRVGIEPTTKGL